MIVISGSGALPDQSSLEASLKGKTLGLPVRVEALASGRFEFETR